VLLVTSLERTFLPGNGADSKETPDAQTMERSRRRYFAGLRRLRQAGIKALAEERAGAETYVSLRSQWDPHIRALAPASASGARDRNSLPWRPLTRALSRGK